MALSLAKMRSDAVQAHQAGDLPRASRLYAAYLAQVPGDAAIWSNLGVLHRVAGRHAIARRIQDRAYQTDPDAQGVANNMANILSDVGDYDRSIALRHDILAQSPGELQHVAMIGRCLRGKGDYAAAIDWLSAAHAAHPDDAEIQVQLAFAQLGAGDYAAGLENYKARWRAGELQPRDLPFPEWQGEDLTGKTIVVLPEQGFGDAVLFTRFLSVLSGRGATVKMVVKPPLRRLLSDLVGVDEVVTELTTQTRTDYWVNMMDLAALHFAEGGVVPPPSRLSVPRDATERAQQLTAPYRDRFRVGVVWTGSVTYRGNVFRSFSHTDYLPLTTIPGVQVFSLYKGPALDALYADGSDAFMLDTGSSERDFADCAAMMQGMDLVVTSDTATAHIAGSLGIEVWTVLHWDAFWVYRHTGEATEWYPGMRLFRQHAPMEWDGVMADVVNELRARVGER